MNNQDNNHSARVGLELQNVDAAHTVKVETEETSKKSTQSPSPTLLRTSSRKNTAGATPKRFEKR